MSSINLTALSGWTLGTGLEYTTVNGVPTIRHSRLFDAFDNASLDGGLWGTLLAGSGEASETRGLFLKTVIGTDVGAFYYKTAFDRTATQTFTAEYVRHSQGAGGNMPIIVILRVNTTPAAIAQAGTTQLFGILVNTVGQVSIFRIKSVGPTKEYWTGAAWGVQTTLATVTLNKVYKYELSLDGTNWQFIIRNYDGTAFYIGPASPLSELVADTTDEWLCFHDIYNDANSGEGRYLAVYQPYITTAITATMPSIAVARTIDALDIVEGNDTGASITWGYDIGSGLVSGLTLAQLKAALIGTNPATLSLIATMTALANARASFAFDGNILAGYSNIVANTISNATVVSRTNRKVISL